MIKITERERIAVQKRLTASRLKRSGKRGKGKGTYYILEDDYPSIKYVASLRKMSVRELKGGGRYDR